MGIIAVAQYTIKTISESITYDGSFDRGTEMWSQDKLEYFAPTNTVVKQDSTSEYGGNILEITNENRLYSREFIPLQKNRIYKVTFRIKQKTNPTDMARNKCYAGACLFDSNKQIIPGVNQNGNVYFTVSGASTPTEWTTYTGYFGQSATAKPGVTNVDSNARYFKPMFIVNYSAGNGVALVDSLTYEDVTDAWELEKELANKLDSDSQAVFDALTDNGRIQGIYMKDKQLYVNGEYINAKNLRVTDKNGNLTLGIDDSGNVTIQATTLKIGTKPVASRDDVRNDIANIQVGLRNLVPNSDQYITSDYKIFGNIPQDEIEKLKGKQVSISLDIELNDAVAADGTGSKRVGTEFYIQYSDTIKYVGVWESLSSTPKTVNKRIVSEGIYIPEGTISSIGGVGVYIQGLTGGTARIGRPKVEAGNKATPWSQAPEDIQNELDNKVETGGSIDDINNSSGQIEHTRLNIQGAISYDSLDSEMGKLFKAETDANGNRIQTIINGAMLETGSVDADKLSAYTLNITKRIKQPDGSWKDSTIPTFSVSEEGLIQASGTFKSFNFNGDESNLNDSKDGWIITNNGQSVFNDSIIRGRVELPNAGITNYGGGGNYNILINSDFRVYTPKADIGWDNDKNGTLFLDYWGGYNSGVSKPTEGYHARVDVTTFPFPTVLYRNKNSEIGLANRWMGISEGIVSNTFKANTKYAFSIDIYFTKVGQKIHGGLYHKLTDNETNNFHSGQYSFVSKEEDVNKWKRFTWVFTTDAKLKTDVYSNWYVYGNEGTEGDVYITRLKLEEGETATPYTLTSDEARKEVRIYAGTDYHKRYDAPFKVLQDGTIIATRGEFSGTFTGRLEIGNISIFDTIGTPENPGLGVIEIRSDKNVPVIQVGEEYSMFNSNVFFGTKDDYTFKTNLNTKQLISGKQASIKFEYERDDGIDGIFSNSITINGEKIKLNQGEFIKSYAPGFIKIGTDSPKGVIQFISEHDQNVDGVLGKVDLDVRGGIRTTETVSIGNVDLVPVYPGGLDIFIN